MYSVALPYAKVVRQWQGPRGNALLPTGDATEEHKVRREGPPRCGASAEGQRIEAALVPHSELPVPPAGKGVAAPSGGQLSGRASK